MTDTDTNALTLGALAGAVIAIAGAAYAVTLAIGFVLLPTPAAPIADPWFTIMELLILLIAPSMLVLFASLASLAPRERSTSGVIAIVFAGICCAITMCVHMTVLAAARRVAAMDPELAAVLFSFQWPSVVYALDVLAWDLFFPVATWAAAVTLPRRPYASIRMLLFLSAALSLLGLVGVPMGDMRVRNIGIIGYAALFPIAAGMLAVKLRRHRVATETGKD